MTVQPGFRKAERVPGILILHRAKLRPDEIRIMRGFSVTRPLRTISDLLKDKAVPGYILSQALEAALRRGLLTTKELSEAGKEDLGQLLRTIS